MEVVTIDRSVRPPSFTTRVDGRERETEAHRLSLHQSSLPSLSGGQWGQLPEVHHAVHGAVPAAVDADWRAFEDDFEEGGSGGSVGGGGGDGGSSSSSSSSSKGTGAGAGQKRAAPPSSRVFAAMSKTKGSLLTEHDLILCQCIVGWAKCEKCKKWRKPSVSGVDLDVNKNDRFVCSDMGAVCPQGCKTPEDTSWTSIEAFLGVSVRLNEEEMLGDGSIENALVHLAWKANHADMFKGKVQEFIDSVGDSAFRDVQHLKALLKQLESKIKEKYKPRDEIQEWRSQLDLASSAVEVYRQGWQVCVCTTACFVCVSQCVWRCIAKDGRSWPEPTQ